MTQAVAKQLLEEGTEWRSRLRMIPYRTIGIENGLLKGFVADELLIFEEGYWVRWKYPVLGVAEQPFGQTDGYEVILHPDMV